MMDYNLAVPPAKIDDRDTSPIRLVRIKIELEQSNRMQSGEPVEIEKLNHNWRKVKNFI